MELIKRDSALDILSKQCFDEPKHRRSILRSRELIRDNIPVVDAVPVVRCENCVCYRELDDDHAYCTNHLRETETDDYCSYGIRKDWEHGTD